MTKTRKLTEMMYEELKKSEPRLLSGTSQRHRRIGKKMDAVPTTQNYFHPQSLKP